MRVKKIWAVALLCTLGVAGHSLAETPKRAASSTPVAVARGFTNLPTAVSESAVRAHVMAPSNVTNIKMEEVDVSKEVTLQLNTPVKVYKKTPKLDTGAFGLAVHTALKDLVSGYLLEVRQNGTLIHTGVWNWAQTPADNNKGWTEDTRMHVASVSKFLTGVAMVKALTSKQLSYDTKIVDYLPTHWVKGSKIDQITFRHLLTQTSGFKTTGSSSDYAFMKTMVKNGVAGVGSYDYENMNFGIMRILIPIVRGDVSKGAVFNSQDAALNEQAWDAVTLYHFDTYMQDKVFTPAGVSNVGFAPSGTTALAYPFPVGNGKGWNSGDLSSVAGGAGFRLSVKELLSVMNHVRRKDTVIPSATAQYMLDNYFGIDQAIDTPAGKIFNKNGGWGDSSGRKEQCVAYFFPDGMEAVVFVNSPIGTQEYSLRGVVKDAFIASLKE